ncbi:hypothetical protein COV05_02550 [Candidatus Uhrbacteria bacterium CG10_big_fil_rev_8_21_14_0_10_48_16]|uniref:DUF5673 domain-containing protein n=1 Tax=Candidatus Uhrbacteria bacterium CG10_big_fil_rev_8_21_14_0_10_48_16 TaxID=1975038 RepID=A0A2M8LH95_9BACT|nr:MAG: hypothetical protein COV05_02550 [Candidatus Uhrbacteria bacterium CG10_big_fil_rev_8_21_14_0_10_48_16]
MEAEETQLNIGLPVLAWEVDEFASHQRGRLWYILTSVIGVGLIVYAVATANFLFAIIILMTGVITLLSTFMPPERVQVIITNTGVVVSDMYYDFESIRDFAIVYEPPEIKHLYFEFHSPWHPLLMVPLEDMDPNQVRELLLPFCVENMERVEETLTDAVRRVYKL